MTNETLRNTAESKGSQMAESVPSASPAEDGTSGPGGKSRRDALAVLGKHAAYTAPAVLTILSLTAKRAAAFSF
jgi:hypothetical protein